MARIAHSRASLHLGDAKCRFSTMSQSCFNAILLALFRRPKPFKVRMNSKLILHFCCLLTVAPDAIHHHVKTCRDNMKNMHFIAPEYGSKSCRYHVFQTTNSVCGTLHDDPEPVQVVEF